MRVISFDLDLLSEFSLSPSEAIVLMVIKSFANKEGSCFPAIKTIALHANLSKRSVTRLVERLEDKGLLSRAIGGGRMSTLYHINNDKMSLVVSQNSSASTPKRHTNSYSCNSDPYNTTTPQTPHSGGGGVFNEQPMKSLQEEEIILPEGKFTPLQTKSLLSMLANYSAAEAQVYVDELVGALEIGRPIRNNVSYVRGMLNNGSFVPELGIPIAEQRSAVKNANENVQYRESEPFHVEIDEIQDHFFQTKLINFRQNDQRRRIEEAS